MADIRINKEDIENTDILFDILVENNNIVTDKTLVTATLISIFTDGSYPQIGTQIDGKIYGNENYKVDKMSEQNLKDYRNGLKKALQWLIDDSIVSSVEVSTEKKDNILGVEITFNVNQQNETNIIFDLDNNLEILD